MEESLPAMSSSSSSDMCKICHGGQSEAALITPCRCRGTMAYSHTDCIIKWLNYSRLKKCELCHSKFQLKKNGYKKPDQWKMVSMDCDEFLHISLFLFCLFIIIASITWWRAVFLGYSSYSVFFEEESMRLLVYITYGPLNLLCLVLAVLETKLVIAPIIARWQLLNQDIIILPYSTKDGPQATSNDAGNVAQTQPTTQITQRQPITGHLNWFRIGTREAYNFDRSQQVSSYDQLQQMTAGTYRPLLKSSRSIGSIEGLFTRNAVKYLVVGEEINLSDTSLPTSKGQIKSYSDTSSKETSRIKQATNIQTTNAQITKKSSDGNKTSKNETENTKVEPQLVGKSDVVIEK